MNWEAIGAIAESIGALVVAGTLIFLVVQVRQNSKAIGATITHTNTIAFNDLNSMLAANPRLAEIFERGSTEPARLSDEERYSYTWLVRSYLNLYQTLYDQFLQGTCPRHLWMRHAIELQVILKSPGVRGFLDVDSSYAELFRYIDSLPETPGYRGEFTMHARGVHSNDA